MTTNQLRIPLLELDQGVPALTVNEAFQVVDGLSHVQVLTRSFGSNPEQRGVAPAEGDAHIVGDNASGAWEGQEGRLTIQTSGRWYFPNPKRGFRVFSVEDETYLSLDENGNWVRSETLYPGVLRSDTVSVSAPLEGNLTTGTPLSIAREGIQSFHMADASIGRDQVSQGVRPTSAEMTDGTSGTSFPSTADTAQMIEARVGATFAPSRANAVTLFTDEPHATATGGTKTGNTTSQTNKSIALDDQTFNISTDAWLVIDFGTNLAGDADGDSPGTLSVPIEHTSITRLPGKIITIGNERRRYFGRWTLVFNRSGIVNPSEDDSEGLGGYFVLDENGNITNIVAVLHDAVRTSGLYIAGFYAIPTGGLQPSSDLTLTPIFENQTIGSGGRAIPKADIEGKNLRLEWTSASENLSAGGSFPWFSRDIPASAVARLDADNEALGITQDKSYDIGLIYRSDTDDYLLDPESRSITASLYEIKYPAGSAREQVSLAANSGLTGRGILGDGLAIAQAGIRNEHLPVGFFATSAEVRAGTAGDKAIPPGALRPVLDEIRQIPAGGTDEQYVRGDGSLADFPEVVTNETLTEAINTRTNPLVRSITYDDETGELSVTPVTGQAQQIPLNIPDSLLPFATASQANAGDSLEHILSPRLLQTILRSDQPIWDATLPEPEEGETDLPNIYQGSVRIGAIIVKFGRVRPLRNIVFDEPFATRTLLAMASQYSGRVLGTTISVSNETRLGFSMTGGAGERQDGAWWLALGN